MFTMGISNLPNLWGDGDNQARYLDTLYADIPEEIYAKPTIETNTNNSIELVCELFIRMMQFKIHISKNKTTKLGFIMEAHGDKEMTDGDILKKLNHLESEENNEFNLIILGAEYNLLNEEKIGSLERMTGFESILKDFRKEEIWKIRAYGNEHNLVLIMNIWTRPNQTTALLRVFMSMIEKALELDSDISEILQCLHLNSDVARADILYKKLIDVPELKTLKYNEVIKNTFKTNRDSELISIKDRIQNINYKLNELQNDYSNYQSIKKQLLQNYDDILSHKEIPTEELVNYLLKTKYIKKIGATSNNQSFFIDYEAPMIYYDEDVIEHIRHSYPSESQFIFDAFMDRRYQLYTRCRVIFYPSNFNVSSISIGHRNKDGRFIGNPHIDRYGCFGNHDEAISDWAETNDYIGAITQITAAVLNLNFTDGCVVSELINTLMEYEYDTPTWYDTETELLLTTSELYEIYREEKEDGEAEN